ncbi:HAD-IA family hydrolase [Actinomyces johnsonii]|uniref:HAD-IA family hydrolase n=1 Tax=Actinomyces johnsonii TaxID=544581 RepID=A0A507ZYM7_9ACTO|nr:HAD-IA family hydrolase [Actinomyces johnsonii]KAA8743980.1 HAD-IA family hydrolase [Actinomyces johnsonii]TQD42826.1 HAD-IA family hydrolase [Actinomyces johnsonii]
MNVQAPAAVSLPPSESVSAVVLDYGNVLYAWEPMAAVAGYVSAEAWDEFVADGDFLAWNERLDLGEPFEQVLNDYARAHPERPDWVEILALYRERFPASLTGPVPGVAAVLDELLAAGAALYGLTNFDAGPFERARLLVPQLERFTGIVVSGREHLAKPDDAVFELILQRYDLEAGSTLFVDDSEVNIRAADLLGLRTHHFTGAGRLRAELVALGLLPTPDRR